MRQLIIVFESNHFKLYKIDKIIDFFSDENNNIFEVIPNKDGLIALIDWYFNEINHLIKLEINLFHEFVSENIEFEFNSSIVSFKHEYNLFIIELGDLKTISNDKTIFQTFSGSNFLSKNGVIKGILLDLEIIYDENENIVILEA